MGTSRTTASAIKCSPRGYAPAVCRPALLLARAPPRQIWPHLSAALRKCFIYFAAEKPRNRSPFRELQLDPAIAAIGILAVACVDRLVVGKTGCGQAVSRD